MSLKDRFPGSSKKDGKGSPRPKKLVRIVVSDMDNTFTDTIKAWTMATDRALNRFAKSRGVSTDVIDRVIRTMPDDFRYGDITAMLHTLSARPEFNGKSDEEKRKFEIIDADIRQEWYRNQARNQHFYSTAIDTLRRLKKTGAKFVVFTDSREHTSLRRLWNLSNNHAKVDPKWGGPAELFSLIDALYVKPRGNEPGPTPQSQEEDEFWDLMRQKQRVLPPGTSKPSPDNMRRILKDYGVKPDEAIMLGDTCLDGGSARPAGVEFVWVPYGAQVMEKSLELFDRIGPEHWYIGYDYVKGTFDESSKPDREFHKGLHEIFDHYDFPPKPEPGAENKKSKKRRPNPSL